MAGQKIKCPGCDCKVSLAEVEKNDGACPECGQEIFGFSSSLFDDIDEDDEDLELEDYEDGDEYDEDDDEFEDDGDEEDDDGEDDEDDEDDDDGLRRPRRSM